LTYDDGPDPEVTPKLLEILRRGKAQATFFVLRRSEAWWAAILGQIAADGHAVALHGLEHRSNYWRTNAALLADLVELENGIRELGIEPLKAFRPPFGRIRPDTVSFLRREGFSTVLWSSIPGDFRPADPDVLFQCAVRNLRPGSICVLHDGTMMRPAPVLELTQRLLEHIERQGWRTAALELRSPADVNKTAA